MLRAILVVLVGMVVAAAPGRARADQASSDPVGNGASLEDVHYPGRVGMQVSTATTSVAGDPGGRLTTVVTTIGPLGPVAVPRPPPEPETAPEPAPSPEPSAEPPSGSKSSPEFAPQPYFAGAGSGYVKWLPAESCPEPGAPAVCVYVDTDKIKPYRISQGTAWLEGGFAGPHLGRASLGVRLSLWRLGIESDLSVIAKHPRERSLFGTFDATWALVMRPRVLWRAGVGVAYLTHPEVLGIPRLPANFAFDVTSSLDVFPFEPMIVSGQVDYGMFDTYDHHLLGMVHARGTVGVMLPRHVELYAAYDYRRMGKVTLQGPMLGVRLWF